MLESKLGNGGPGVFHQGQRGDAVAFGGSAINRAHLFGGYDFHECTGAVCAARASSFPSWAGSPITIRKSPAWIGATAVGLKPVCPYDPRISEHMMPNCA